MARKKKSAAVIARVKKERKMLQKEHLTGHENIPGIQEGVNEKADDLDQASECIPSSTSKRTDDNVDQNLIEEISV